jgi:hypothetical protein
MKIRYKNPFYKGQWLGKYLIPTLAFDGSRKIKGDNHYDIYQGITLCLFFLNGYLSISTLIKVKRPVNSMFHLTPSIIYYNTLHFKNSPSYSILFLHKEFKINNK